MRQIQHNPNAIAIGRFTSDTLTALAARGYELAGARQEPINNTTRNSFALFTAQGIEWASYLEVLAIAFGRIKS